MSVVTGSRAYGLDTAGSDVDRRGVFVAPTELFWRLDKPPTHLDGPLPEQFSWEVERFCGLALEANPTVLECLWSPLVEKTTPQGEELRALRPAFLSRKAHRTFLRYAERQFQRATPADGGPVKWKHVMHLLRLLISGRHLVETGDLLVDATPYREGLLAVRRGERTWEDVAAWRDELLAGLDAALAATPLPEAPDRAAVEEFLISVRRRAL
ncbi:nucleotidyltransferase domain-containing protein [Actinocorallia populi]|uniref:nucleotidyltransferase domain-containing protein n=1 Tax=Actinocorallia populi TaxID=2079200 RepID=UPI0022B7EA80|nr:nucleotidyltransferase domain-containing protein [Actinocorallia populi]